MHKVFTIIAMIILVVLLAGCSGVTSGPPKITQVAPAGAAVVETKTVSVSQTASSIASATVNYSRDDLDSSTTAAEMTYITLNGNSITVKGQGTAVNGSTIILTAAGLYSFIGKLNDGQVVVNTADEKTVKIVLNGVDITCSSSAPIYIIKAKNTVITLAEGTQNILSDGNTYVLADASSNEPAATIFSQSDLTINGNGNLTVNASYNNGVQSQDDLKITGGNITIKAVNEGLQGRDSVVIKNGNITIDAGSDGVQTTNSEDAGKGYVRIDGGSLKIISGTDGIQAVTGVKITGGDISITSGGGSVNSSNKSTWGNWGRLPIAPASTASSAPSAKGIKAGVDVTISGGKITIDSSDDSLHSNQNMTVDGGMIVLSSGDDGMHADATLVVNGGEITIKKSYEGIESAAITVNNGTLRLVSSDDGFNGAGGADGSSINGRPGQNPFSQTGSCTLDFNGGYIYVDAGGDGLDVNGPLNIRGGTIIVNGPTANDNGPLDYTGTFNINGGFLVAVGSSGMAQAPSATSDQYSVMINLTSAQAAGILFHIEAENGQNILTFKPTKQYQSVLLCSPDLKNGASYTVYTGGSVTGTVVDGLYSDVKYATGTVVASLKIAGKVTVYGTTFGPGGGGGMPPRRW